MGRERMPGVVEVPGLELRLGERRIPHAAAEVPEVDVLVPSGREDELRLSRDLPLLLERPPLTLSKPRM
jgi:hypothetical protein